MDQTPINDVRRKLNEVMKKTDERIVVGWRPDSVKRKEGDKWTDADGREWTVKNGVTQNITKLDGAKTPWFCPKCEKAMNHRLDIKFWRLRGYCFDCNINAEAEIRRQGKWEEYERNLMRANYVAFLKDKIQELQHYHDTASAPEIVHSDGEKILMIEKWHVNIDKLREDLTKDLTELKELLRKAEEEGIYGFENPIEPE